MTKKQIEALNAIVEYAYNHTVFYKELYDITKIKIGEIKSVTELPIVTSKQLREDPHSFRTDERTYKVVMTSGTISTPKILYRTEADFDISVENECRLLKWAKVDSNDIVCIVQPFGINGYGELTLEACKRIGAFAIPLGDVSDEMVISAILHFSPTVLDIPPSRLISILPRLLKSTTIRLAMVAGERISDKFKSSILKNYGISVVNQFGSTELDALAAERYNENGLHLLSDSFIFETVNHQLVVTSLYHKGTPLIRYLLGDIAEIEDEIITIQGRNVSVQLTDGVVLDQCFVDDVVEKYNGIFWQCVIYSKKNTLCLEFYIYGEPDLDCLAIENELKFSLDFDDLVTNNQISILCLPTQSIIGNTRKARRFFDTSNNTEETQIALLKHGCIEAFYYSLPRLTNTNLKRLFSCFHSVNLEKLLELVFFITHFWNSKTWKLCPKLLHYCYEQDARKVFNYCIGRATSSDWEIREDAAKFIAIMLINEFDTAIPWINDCILSDNENVRRAILLSLKYCIEYDPNYDRYRAYLDLLDAFLFDNSKYVKKSFDSFTIGDGFLNVCPGLVKQKFDEWTSYKDVRVDCCIIRSFKSSGGVKTWPLAKHYIELYRSNNSYYIQKTLNATINYLKKRLDWED